MTLIALMGSFVTLQNTGSGETNRLPGRASCILCVGEER
jgi:hypothetical protein